MEGHRKHQLRYLFRTTDKILIISDYILEPCLISANSINNSSKLELLLIKHISSGSKLKLLLIFLSITNILRRPVYCSTNLSTSPPTVSSPLRYDDGRFLKLLIAPLHLQRQMHTIARLLKLRHHHFLIATLTQSFASASSGATVTASLLHASPPRCRFALHILHISYFHCSSIYDSYLGFSQFRLGFHY
jgi:hypothetical protein